MYFVVVQRRDLNVLDSVVTIGVEPYDGLQARVVNACDLAHHPYFHVLSLTLWDGHVAGAVVLFIGH